MPETVTPTTDPAPTPSAPPAAAAPTTPEPEKEPDWKAEARKWEARAKENRTKLDEAAPKLSEYDKLVAASKTELEKAQDAAQKSAARELAANTRAAKAEIRVQAGQKFLDPDIPFAFVDPTKFIGADGDIDQAAIAAALDQVLADKPNLAKTAGSRTPAPNPAQGSSADGPATPSQLTQADVKRLYAEKKYDEIEKARQDGRLATVLGAQP